MTRRNVLLVAASLLLLVGVLMGGIRLVAALQWGTSDTEMTKSVARLIFTGTYLGKPYDKTEICTGSVVSDGWILTALHCIYPNGYPAGEPVNSGGITVQLWRAGMDVSDKYESGLSTDQPFVPMPGARLYPENTGIVNYRDVVLLHVAASMRERDWVKTIPMAPAWPAIGIALTQYGYGNLDGSKSSPAAPALQKSRQGSITRANCPSGFTWTSGHLCTTSSSSLAWKGDSGGPLLWWNNGYWQQVGNFSQFSTDFPNQTWRSFWSEADGYTRNWILSTVGARFPAGAILRDMDSGASWLHGDDGYRERIPDDATYNCLINNGAPVINAPQGGLPLRTIEALPEMVASEAACTPKQPTGTPPTVTPPTVTPPTVTPPTVTPPTVAPTPHPVDAYSNYGQSNLAGHAMCRGNPGDPLSMPGGVGTQTFSVPAGVASLNSAVVQIDPASVTAHLSIAVNGTVEATTAADAIGDTRFNFGSVSVRPGDVVTLTISFTATYGKIITLYTVGNPGGSFTAQNSCPDGAPNFSTTSSGLRAIVSGMS